MPPSLQGIAQQAHSPPGSRFRTLYGMRNEDFLKQCWRAIRQEATSGVEAVSAQAYAQPLDAHIHHLVERRKQKRSRATLVRRHDMPTGDGTQRPLGSPAGKDTRRQLAVARLLAAIAAQDVRRGSDGYRPQVGALEAVDTRPIQRPWG
jgi:RNA-directed DNA polymerase